MKVSIITATFNSGRTIRHALNSVKEQTHKNIEHIIVDGGSTDNTLLVINDFGHRGLLVSESDNGIYDAMNKGIAMATGDVIGILNSDDFYASQYVIEEVCKMMRDKQFDAVYGDLLFVDNVSATTVVRKWVAGGYSDSLFYSGWMPPHPTFFVKKSLYDNYGVFNLHFKNSADYELLLRFIFLYKVKTGYLTKVLVHMRTGGRSTATLKIRLNAHKEDYHAWKVNGIVPRWYTLIMKPMRKINQFVNLKRSICNSRDVGEINSSTNEALLSSLPNVSLSDLPLKQLETNYLVPGSK